MTTARPPRPSDRTSPTRAFASVRLALVRLFALVVACSGSASAHGFHGTGRPVGFAVVVVVPVLAGLAGGLAAVSRRTDAVSVPHVGTAFALGLVALGLAVLLPAVADAPMLSTGLAVSAGLAGRVVLDHDESHRGGNAALAAVGVHRFVEGSALGVAYGVGTAVGAVGAVVFAGHAVVEAALIGGLHARIGRRRALVAVVAVQASFVLGALVGGSAFPSSGAGRAAVLAVAGGVLVAVGLDETGWASPVGHWHPVARLR